MAEATYDVLVIGAGMAGLTAARALTEAALKVLVIEAQERIGGRIFTKRVGDEAIELGAEFIHGLPPELWSLIHEAGLETYERKGTQLCFEDGALGTCFDEMQEAFEPLEKLENFEGPDLTFAEYLDRERVPPEKRGRAIGYVEGFNAADHREISAASLGVQQKAEDDTEGDRLFCIHGGYDQLPAHLARRISTHGGSILTGTPVREIRWRPEQVEVITSAGSFLASHAVITLPLGILQGNAVSISPRPSSIMEAAARLRMGQVCRFTMLFRERFWQTCPPQPALGEMSFLFSFSETPPVWWTPHPADSNTITGWLGGPRSAALADLSDEALSNHACEALSKIFRMEEARIQGLLQGCYTHDWKLDPYTLGAYSYVAAGGLDASRQMTEPVEDTLYFAGEHTDTTGHWGTVHAAIRSGLRAAEQVLHRDRAAQKAVSLKS